jgi:arylsulfatase A-like enzyme
MTDSGLSRRGFLYTGAAIAARKPQPAGRMLRTQRYKYCVYSEGRHREELVDLEKDPGEMANLARSAVRGRAEAAWRAARGLVQEVRR